jgi:hypothetical protein
MKDIIENVKNENIKYDSVNDKFGFYYNVDSIGIKYNNEYLLMPKFKTMEEFSIVEGNNIELKSCGFYKRTKESFNPFLSEAGILFYSNERFCLNINNLDGEINKIYDKMHDLCNDRFVELYSSLMLPGFVPFVLYDFKHFVSEKFKTKDELFKHVDYSRFVDLNNTKFKFTRQYNAIQ